MGYFLQYRDSAGIRPHTSVNYNEMNVFGKAPNSPDVASGAKRVLSI